MIKKLVSFLGVLVILGTLIPGTAFALTQPEESLITSVTLSDPNTFDPHGAELLGITVDFNDDFALQLSNSTGRVQVKKGAVVLNTLVSWQDEALPAVIPDWDGKAIDNVAAEAVCGNAGAVCPAAEDYKIEVQVEYDQGADTFFDIDTASFTLLPKVAVTGLSVNPSTFNPLNQTADISFTTTAEGFITTEILDGGTVKRSLLSQSISAGLHDKSKFTALAWDGKDGSGSILPNKAYTLKVSTRVAAGDPVLHEKTSTITVNSPQTIIIGDFSLTTDSGDTVLDPAPGAGNELLSINYTLNQAADNVTVTIKNSDDDLLKSFSSNLVTTTFVWDGKFASKLVPPGTYTATVTASKSGESPVTDSKTFSVSYPNANKSDIVNFQVVPTSFDPDVEDAVIEFQNTKDSDLTVEIRNASDSLRTFTDYKNDSYNANDTHSIVWDGTNNVGTQLSVSTYKAVIIARNDFGVVQKETNVSINNTGGSISTSNSHISDIKFRPSTKFEPAKDEELEIEFDIEKDLDSLRIVAARGSETVEIFDEEDLDKESNVEVLWDGTDDNDDFVDKGSWRIEFNSKSGSTELVAAKSIDVDYEKPGILDLEVSKNKFDNELGEFTYILFRVDQDANVTLQVLEGNDVDDEIVEDMEIDKDVWYAVQWDGGSYDYDDDLDIRLTAENVVQEDIYDTEKISIDLAEDDIIGNRSNVTLDFIEPVITGGNEDMILNYTLEEEADVEITIHKGKSSSGSTVITLLDINDQEGGDHEIAWNGKTSSGNTLSKGFYTYKIISRKGGTETETGTFVVGNIGAVDSGGSGSSTGSAGGSNNVAPGVIVDGVLKDDGVSDGGDGDFTPSTSVGNCGGFPDVMATSKYCEAIDWVYEEGIFKGYPDGTFRENIPINRVEILKVILEALLSEVDTNIAVAGNLGFTDVQVGAWYMPYINLGKILGIFQGDSGKNTARPADTVNRVEALKLLFETLRVSQGYITSTCVSFYPDVDASSWYFKYVCEAQNYALFDLVGGVNFAPGALSTRGEMAEVLFRLHVAGLI